LVGHGSPILLQTRKEGRDALAVLRPLLAKLFSEGDFFHRLQAEVTYTHAPDLWKGPVPKFAGAALPKAMKKLRAREPLILCLSGDSISQGYNASGLVKAPPQMPAYGELVALGLERAYGSKITFRNFAVAGWNSDQGLADAKRVAAEKPDLVIIAYGMNDTGKPAAKFAANIRGIMDRVREGSPGAEFILVAPMLGNAEWHALRMESFPAFRDALGELAAGDRGAARADLTSVWTELLKRKSFLDLTGNGVNHPNDFGHRLYAQVILAMLVEK